MYIFKNTQNQTNVDRKKKIVKTFHHMMKKMVATATVCTTKKSKPLKTKVITTVYY